MTARGFIVAVLLVFVAVGLGTLYAHDQMHMKAKAEAIAMAKRKRPCNETCRPPDAKGWTATIEPAADGGWACVMRNKQQQEMFAFFYL